ncbi:Multiple epidermal growth factor-like domains protein 8 [Dissophora ornata]|nr:Multiple epidermal growth factor-like domains protein 8 [Dissophora ornata]
MGGSHEPTQEHYSSFQRRDTSRSIQPIDRRYAPFLRRDLVSDVIGNSEDKDPTTEPASRQQSTSSNSKAVPYQTNVASVLCNSNIPQSLGPAWSGTFASNSPDGVYPSQTRSCTWTIQAVSNGTGSDGSGSNSRPTPYVIAVNFTSPIQLVCGMDYLTLYDGSDATAPVLATICGNAWVSSTPIIYSTGPQLTAVFSSQAQSPGSAGFSASWSSVAPCSICVPTARGTCSSTNVCNCYNRYSGAVCESDTAGFKDFTPRSQHAMAYDPNDDIVYIMGGTSLQNTFMWDLLTYTFATNKWAKIILNTKSPDPRYGHFAFMYNTNLYVYGGISVIGGLADLWKFDGKVWTQQQAINPEKLPAGRTGSACVVVTNSNSTKLYVFGGLDASGVTTRDLNVYDINLAMWKSSDHQNSVGLSGATAVYHQDTDSIYYFGGMVNQTTRNVLTYQYRISQDLWYALAPRIDPLTATPVAYWNGTQSNPSPTFNTSAEDTGDDIVTQGNSSVQYLAPVMYDSVTAVWAPAGLMGDDSVVMFGGMRPYGPGVDEKEQACYSGRFVLYDLSCQKWTTYDTPDLDAAMKGRVNHTMIMRPPGAAGGSKTAWTAYIFGGFDGTDRADMLNVTMNITATTPSAVNNCRDKAKNTDYLLGASADIPKTGTVQDLVRQRPDLKSQVLLTSDGCPTRNALDLDNPFSGTIQAGQEMPFKIYVDAQDLDIQFEIRTVPTSALDFKSLNVWDGFMNMYWRADHGLSDDSWDGYSETTSPIPADVPATPDNVTLGDGPIVTATGTLNTSELMNRWTKYAGLDASLSSSAVRQNGSYVYFPAVDPRRFSGYYVFSLTNRNPSALSFTVTVTLLHHPTTVDKPTGTQFNMATLGFFMLGFIFAVVLLIFLVRKIRQLIEDRDASHRAAEMQLLEDEEEERSRNGGGLNGGMAMVQMDGTMLIKKPLYRIVVGVQDLNRHISVISGGTFKHREIRGNDSFGSAGGTDKKHIPRSRSESVPQVVDREDRQQPEKRRSRVRSDYIRDIGSVPLLFPPAEETELEPGSSVLHSSLSIGDFRRMSASTPDLRRDLNSNLMEDVEAVAEDVATPKQSKMLSNCPEGNKRESKTDTSTEPPSTQSPRQSSSLQRGWSLKSLGQATSFKRSQKSTNSNVEEREALTSQGLQEEDEGASRASSRCYDSEQEMTDLGALSAHTDLLQIRQDQLEMRQRELEVTNAVSQRRRNPIKVQPLSVEPLPFHTGLVPRTLPNLRRYQKFLARQQQQRRQASSESLNSPGSISPGAGIAGAQGSKRPTMHSPSRNTLRSNNGTLPSSRNHPTTSSSASQRLQPRQIRATRSQGSLREVHKVASRMTLRTNAEVLFKDSNSKMARSKSVNEKLSSQGRREWFGRDDSEADLEAGIELRQLVASNANSHHNEQPCHQQQQLEQQCPPEVRGQQVPTTLKRKPIKMRGRLEYEPGPLLAMNYLIVFPGDAGSRRVRQQGDLWRSNMTSGERGGGGEQQQHNDDTLYNTETRLPPMAIGTVFVPDPVRWWTYKAKQVLDRQKFERQMRRMDRLKEQAIKPPPPAKTR